MSASVAIATKRSNPNPSDAGYKWFLENRNELLEITASDDLLHTLRYATTWDAYHEALDSDQNLATIARAYAQAHPSSLHHRIDATGTFIF